MASGTAHEPLSISKIRGHLSEKESQELSGAFQFPT